MSEPTHALYIVDNYDGEGYRYWIFAYQKDSVFYSSENSKPVLEYEGDRIIKEVPLYDKEDKLDKLHLELDEWLSQPD